MFDRRFQLLPGLLVALPDTTTLPTTTLPPLSALADTKTLRNTLEAQLQVQAKQKRLLSHQTSPLRFVLTISLPEVAL